MAEEITNEELKGMGVKIGFLIKNSTMPEDVKKELFDILPLMDINQMERLMNMLEAKLIDEQTRDIDKEYKEKIDKAYREHSSKQQEVDKKFLKRIKETINHA